MASYTKKLRDQLEHVVFYGTAAFNLKRWMCKTVKYFQLF